MKLVTVSVFVFICVAAWWLESRFGATTAVMVIGGALGVICVIIGYMLSMANQKFTLHNAAMFNRDNATVERYRAATDKELARAARERESAQARIDLLEARRVDQLATKRAGLLVDVERQKWEAAQRRASPRWAVDDDGPAGGLSEWE